ncbi:hypothetical protein FTUN_7227 [Frigoriglobus tundricola]|uniref:Uncharacterized protein n=1 Tax=Frigoriglobus tundricola TaxID=2774151 RepID=A0A6M5Z269_9BACT|nr:hypothetical protein FTUN_7227 [Frigoriglobus tundricola]
MGKPRERRWITRSVLRSGSRRVENAFDYVDVMKENAGRETANTRQPGAVGVRDG